MHCERCECDGHDSFVVPYILYGNAYVCLCNRCVNEWAVFIRDHFVWQNVLEVEAKENYVDHQGKIGEKVDYATFLAMRIDQERVQKRVRDLALAFLKKE